MEVAQRDDDEEGEGDQGTKGHFFLLLFRLYCW